MHEALRSGHGGVAELYRGASFEKVPFASAEVLSQWPVIDTNVEAIRKECPQILPGRTLRGSKESLDLRLWRRPLLVPAKTSPGFKDPLAAAKEWTRKARQAKAKEAAAAAAAPSAGPGAAVASSAGAEALRRAPAPAAGGPSQAAPAAAPAPAAATPQPPPAASTVALLFPGQGSQYVGMAASLRGHPKVEEYNEAAKRILGYDLLDLCQRGTMEQLEETTVCQPAVFLASMAGLEKLRETEPEAAASPGAVAGLSLGEYTALCVAGVFTFEEGLELLKVRSKAMAEVFRLRPQAVLSVAGLELDVLRKLCEELSVGGEVCRVTNLLFPRGFACAGTREAVESLREMAMSRGAMQARIVSNRGASHTELMKPVQAPLEAALKKLLPRMRPPRCDVYVNRTGQRVARGTPPSVFVPLLLEQLCNEVLWEAGIKNMVQDGLTDFFEVGPLTQLQSMMKRIDPIAGKSTKSVSI